MLAGLSSPGRCHFATLDSLVRLDFWRASVLPPPHFCVRQNVTRMTKARSQRRRSSKATSEEALVPVKDTMIPNSRSQKQKASKASPKEIKQGEEDVTNEGTTQETYEFDGKKYDSYQDMVDAKRKRNFDVLVKSGLLDISASLKEQTKAKAASQRGIAKKRKTDRKDSLPCRKSSRLAGVQAEGIYVESERSGKFTISGGTGESGGPDTTLPSKPEFFNNRIAKEGASLSIKDVVELAESKWVREDSVDMANKFVSEGLSALQVKKKAARSPTSVTAMDECLTKKITSLSADDDHNVTKVTPDRIYSVACHPSPDKLIVCAGDKQGYVGMWNVDDSSEGDGVHLFRVHGRPVSCLSWTPSGRSLLSASYDGSVRWFDVESQTFDEIFATYDDSGVYRDHLGRGLDQGYNYWIQFVCPDHRNSSDQVFFISTSYGTAMHVDLRVGKGKLTFHENLSEKKINTLR